MPCATQTNETERFPGRDGERHRPNGLSDSPVDGQDNAFRRGGRPDIGVAHRAAYDLLDQIVRRRIPDPHRRNPPSVAKHGHTVGDPEHLVETMGDINDANPARTKPPQGVDEAADIRLRQRGRRLVENEDVGFHRERPPDCDERALRGGEL